ncbi:hypothetical protein UA70_05780 [Raoultella planticola]|nr:hypothetical protein UA70_05780 [Raoultella planticola]
MQDDNHAFMPYPPQPVPHALSGPRQRDDLCRQRICLMLRAIPPAAVTHIYLALSGIKRRTAPVVQRLLDNGARYR